MTYAPPPPPKHKRRPEPTMTWRTRLGYLLIGVTGALMLLTLIIFGSP